MYAAQNNTQDYNGEARTTQGRSLYYCADLCLNDVFTFRDMEEGDLNVYLIVWAFGNCQHLIPDNNETKNF